MAHYSEMDFLFSNTTNRNEITRILNQSTTDENGVIGKKNLFKNSYTVYKESTNIDGSQSNKNYIRKSVYDPMKSSNPYVDLINEFNKNSGTEGAGLKINAVDLAYLRDLGVYPINRMIVLRRFPDGCFVPEDLTKLKINPISTVIGWLKPDQNFGTISFNENWSTTSERFDVALSEILKKATGGKLDTANMIPMPDFAQGLLFEFYSKAGLTSNTIEKDVIDEKYERYDQTSISKSAMDLTYKDKKYDPSLVKTSAGSGDTFKSWGLNSLPIGDPNVLQEAPFRNPEGQNIQSTFSFELETTYEQKLLGDVDPGSAMLDIIENLLAMGTSNMVFYWGSESPTVTNIKNAVKGSANDWNAWWVFVSEIMLTFWETLKELFKNAVSTVSDALGLSESASKKEPTDAEKEMAKKEKKDKAVAAIESVLNSILTSTIAIHRFRLRASLELMIGGSDSSTPWYITIGNPFSPWLATNHIVVKSASIETSPEMGFNDQPQRITAKFTVQFSRSLGKQEIMRMFNNSFRRNYTAQRTTAGETETSGSNLQNSTAQMNLAPTTPNEATFEF